MARPVGTRPIPWLADRDKLKQQFYEEVKFKLDGLTETLGTIAVAGSLTVKGSAGAIVPAYRAVTTDNLGKIIVADAGILNHADRVLGISINSALPGEDVIYVTSGDIENQGWALQAEAPIFLGLDGALVTDPSVGVFQARLGYAKTSTLIAVRICMAIAF